MAITITDFAAEKIYELMAKTQCEDSLLKVSLNGGGCSGYTYSFDFIPEALEDDKIFDFGNIKICIDKKSYLYLNGTEIDYEETPFKSGIKLNIPNATRTCGCGESIAF